MVLKDERNKNLNKFMFNEFNLSYISIYSELYLLLSILFIISFLVIFDNIYNQKLLLIKISGFIYIYILLITFFISYFNYKINFSTFFKSFINNNFTSIIKIVLIIVLLFISIISLSYLKYEYIYSYEFFILLNFVLLGLFTIITSNDLLVMYIGIEILSLSFYLLTTLKIYSNFSTEAGLKYFILGAFSSGLLLYGSSLIYGSVGSINFVDIDFVCNNLEYIIVEKDNNSILFGSFFIIISLLFKLGAAPFHMWLPDVYEGSPTIVTFIFSIIPKISILALFFRFNKEFNNLNDYHFLINLLSYVSILSIVIGSLGALYQKKIKRLLAYSAISHMGFLLIGFLIFESQSLFALFFYLFVYIIISINIFNVILMLRKYTNNFKFKKLTDFALLYKTHPLVSINFAIILFSVAGIPPLAGFYSKLYIFIAGINFNLFFIIIIAAIFSVLSCYYYIRLIKLLFFKEFDYWILLVKINYFESILLSSTLLFNLFFFSWPDLFVVYIYDILIDINLIV